MSEIVRKEEKQSGVPVIRNRVLGGELPFYAVARHQESPERPPMVVALTLFPNHEKTIVKRSFQVLVPKEMCQCGFVPEERDIIGFLPHETFEQVYRAGKTEVDRKILPTI